MPIAGMRQAVTAIDGRPAPPWRQVHPSKPPPRPATVDSEMGQKTPPALQKRSGDLRLKGQTCSANRDRLSTEQLRRMTDATAGVHRGAWWCGGGVAAGGAGATA